MVYRDGKKVKDTDSSEDESGPDSTLIPKSILSGIDVKVGDTIRLKVAHLFDDEIEVEYAHSKGKSEDDSSKSEDEGADMANADSALDAMAAPSEA